MFSTVDVIILIISTFLILPMVSIIHELGHIVFAYLFKAKKHVLDIGCGKVIFSLKTIRVRQFYFWYSWCQFESLQKNTRFHYIIVYAGPMMFNILSALFVNGLVYYEFIEESIFWKQFVYYSFFFVIFDLIPMRYPNKQPSNGLVIYEMIRYGKEATFKKEEW